MTPRYEIALYFSVNNTLDHWIVEESDGFGKVTGQENASNIVKATGLENASHIVAEYDLSKYPEHLRPLLSRYLLPQAPGQEKSVLEMLSFLVMQQEQQKLVIGEQYVADVRTYVLPHGECFLPKHSNQARYTPVDQILSMMRKKNNTYTSSEEMYTVFDHITDISRFPGSAELTQTKTDILYSFNEFRIEKSGEIFSRSKLVEEWAETYYKNTGKNPFEDLSMQRRTGCLAFFNPKVTDSMAFFHKFVRGEPVPPSLQSWFDLKPNVDHLTKRVSINSF